jgi:hypothetical protein
MHVQMMHGLAAVVALINNEPKPLIAADAPTEFGRRRH